MEEKKNNYRMQLLFIILPLLLVLFGYCTMHELKLLDYILLTFSGVNLVVLIVSLVRNRKDS